MKNRSYEEIRDLLEEVCERDGALKELDSFAVTIEVIKNEQFEREGVLVHPTFGRKDGYIYTGRLHCADKVFRFADAFGLDATIQPCDNGSAGVYLSY